MRATNSARLFVAKIENAPAETPAVAAARAAQPASRPGQAPALRVLPVLRDTQPRRFVRVPTHAIGADPELREYPRAILKLPLRLRRVNHILEEFPVTLVTRDISSTGVYFLCPKPLEAGASIELEILLVSRPPGPGDVPLVTTAQVQRPEPPPPPKLYGLAPSFDASESDPHRRIP